MCRDYFRERGALVPIVQITLQQGRTAEQKQALFRAVTTAIQESLGAAPHAIRIMIYEVSPWNFAVGGIPIATRDAKEPGPWAANAATKG